MVVAGSLNDIVRSLQVSVAVGGQLVAVSAAVVAFGAPLVAVGGRRDSTAAGSSCFTLIWYAVGHALAALMPNFATLLPVRALGVLAAAAFTPQAAAALSAMTAPAERGRAITFIFLGWSLASVLGMPLHSYIGETFGWRWAFGLVALLSAPAAWWVWRTMPDGVKPPPMSLTAWRQTLTHPALMAIVFVTACSAAGQFTLFSYFAPYYSRELGASAARHQRAVPVLRRLRPDRQPAAHPLHRPARRQPLRRASAWARSPVDGAVAAGRHALGSKGPAKP